MKTRKGGVAMPDYKKLYFQLFGRLSTAVEQLEQHNFGTAQAILIQALVDAEDTYLAEEVSA